jgi:hypothetical protein
MVKTPLLSSPLNPWYSALQVDFKGELSDCSMLKMPAEPHEMRILLQQHATGKTNQDGRWLFGRVMRHKDVLVCGVGAFAMYLALRFHINKGV